ncbi:MAG: hypothetical protein M1826_004299 [Phylliscum demangeonii]|nr:MAG: hypothetical protein M1826_004299 [Phylliscum demangeonii]
MPPPRPRPRPAPKPARPRANRPPTQSPQHDDDRRPCASNPKQKPLSTIPIPVALQQSLLHIFQHTFASSFSSGLPHTLQEIKGLLYARDFAPVFERGACRREAYAVRWSAGRALAYLTVFADVWAHVRPRPALDPLRGRRGRGAEDGEEDEEEDKGGDVQEEKPRPRMMMTKVVCLGGGGGAELVALAGLARLLRASPSSAVTAAVAGAAAPSNPPEQEQEQEKEEEDEALLSIDIIDRGDWASILQALLRQTTRTTTTTTTTTTADLVTLMFTLNELYATSRTQTTQMLLALRRLLTPGALLLVVDSPGTYSTVTLAGAGAAASPATAPANTYPMHWLLDRTLLSSTDDELERDTDMDGERPSWSKVLQDESRWFRLPDGLRYPIPLENTRYQMHLYRRN